MRRGMPFCCAKFRQRCPEMMKIMKAVKKKWSAECGKIRILFAVFTALLIVLLWGRTACAQEENEIWERLQGQLDALELGRAEELYMQYGNGGFGDTVKAIFEGKYEAGGTTRALLGLILPEVSSAIGIFTLLYLLAAGIGAVEKAARTERFFGITGSIASGVFALIFFGGFLSLCKRAGQAAASLNEVTDAVFPALTALLTAAGGKSTAAVLNTECLAVSQSVNNAVNTVIVPVILLLCVILLLDCTVSENRFDRALAFGKSTAGWCVGMMYTFYGAVVGIRGLSAASYDGVALRAFRYTLGSSVPLAGSLLGDGVNLALAGCAAVKNAFGTASLLLTVFTVLAPFSAVVMNMLALRAFTAFCGAFAPSGIIRMAAGAADLLKLLAAVMLGAGLLTLSMMGIAIFAAGGI